MTYAEIADKLLSLFEMSKFEKCETCGHRNEDRLCFKAEVFSKEHEDNRLYELLSEIMYDLDVDQEYSYIMVYDALQEISSVDPESYDDLADISVEPPVYTSDLAKFIASHSSHATFIGQAIDEYGTENVLTSAYDLAQREVTSGVISLVDDLSNEQDKQ